MLDNLYLSAVYVTAAPCSTQSIGLFWDIYLIYRR
jgi:hypothetical protein